MPIDWNAIRPLTVDDWNVAVERQTTVSNSLEDSFEIPPARNTTEFPWPIGLYLCRLDSLVQEKPGQHYQEGDPPRIRFTFTVQQVIDADDKRKARELMRSGDQMLAWCPLNMGPRAWFRQWAEALLGRELAEKERIGPNDLVQRYAKVSVGTYKRRDGQTAVGVQILLRYNEDDEDDEPPAPVKAPPAPVAADDDWMDDPAPTRARAERDPAVR